MTLVDSHHETNLDPDTSQSPTAANNATLAALEDRLLGLLDLQLTLKHIHWNVVGPAFIAVHEMLDEQVASVREMTDAVAERIATLRGVPIGTPQHLVSKRTWNDYDLGRASVTDHMEALNRVYEGVISDHRHAMKVTAETDPVTEDLFIGQLADLELFQWFVRSHVDGQ